MPFPHLSHVQLNRETSSYMPAAATPLTLPAQAGGLGGQGPGSGDQATLTLTRTRWNRLPVMWAWIRPFR